MQLMICSLCVNSLDCSIYINLFSSYKHGFEDSGGNAALIDSGAADFCSVWAKHGFHGCDTSSISTHTYISTLDPVRPRVVCLI